MNLKYAHIGLSASGVPENAGIFQARENWNRIVDWAINNRVDAVALTGDIVDKDNCFFEAVGALQKGFRKLADNQIEVYAVAGNHDYEVLPQVIRSGKLTNVHLLGSDGNWELDLFTKGKEKVYFMGWSFTKQYTREDPLSMFRMPETDPGIPTIGLLHGDVYTQGSKYAPVNVEKLKTIRIDVWILGHIHKPDVLNDVNPYVCYPGSPLALSGKETGIHGPLLFTVNNNNVNKPERVILSPVRFEDIAIDITGTEDKENFRLRLTGGIMETAESLEGECPDSKCLVCSIECTGIHKDASLLESWSKELADNYELGRHGDTTIYVRAVSINVVPEITNIRELSDQKTPVGFLAGIITAIEDGKDDERLSQLINKWKDDYRRINRSDTYLPLSKDRESGDLADKAARRYLLRESRRLLGELLKQKQE
jgi:exonuclease SbcD